MDDEPDIRLCGEGVCPMNSNKYSIKIARLDTSLRFDTAEYDKRLNQAQKRLLVAEVSRDASRQNHGNNINRDDRNSRVITFGSV